MEEDESWAPWSGAEEGEPSGFQGGAGAEPEPDAEKSEGEQLRDYLKRMNPEDFGRFEP